MSDISGSHDDDPMTQIARLKEQLEALRRERVAPVVDAMVDRVEAAAHDAASKVHARTEQLAEKIRIQPVTSVLIAAALGFLLGRAAR